MKTYNTGFARKLFVGANGLFLLALAVSCLLPFIHILSISLSDKNIAAAGEVFLWPIGFTTESYQFLVSNNDFFYATWMSVRRTVLGVAINLFCVVLAAYPLSKETRMFRWRTAYVWFFVFTMFFSGGLIPTYILITKLGLIDTVWALVLPGAVPFYYAVLMLNFFRGIPKGLEEAALIDGGSDWTVLFRIFVPISMPSIATIILFCSVNHWNSWFDGMLYLNKPRKYPLMTYLQMVTLSIRDSSSVTDDMTQETLEMLEKISPKTVQLARLFLATLPILLVYPFLQRYFVKGIVVGSVKG